MKAMMDIFATRLPEPSEAALRWAEDRMQNDSKLYKSSDAKIYKLQVRCYAYAYRDPSVPVNIASDPLVVDKTPEEIEAEILAKIVHHDRSVSTGFMGQSSIFAGVSLWDEKQTRETQVVKFFQTDFSPLKHKNCLVLGGTGSGKTYGVVGYVASVADTAGHVKFMNAYKLYEVQRSNLAADREVRDWLDVVKYLIVDDLGTEPQSGYRNADFVAYFQNLFISRHQNNRFTFITSNSTLKDFTETFGERLVSRFRETGVVFETADSDMRTIRKEI